MNNSSINKQTIIISLVRAIAFSLTTMFYTSFGAPLSNYLWCVYIGFIFTLRLGATPKQLPRYFLNLMSGLFWGYLFFNVTVWIKNIMIFPDVLGVGISEFILTFVLLYTHLKILKDTYFNLVNCNFLMVALVFANKGFDLIIYGYLSLVGGVVLAVFTTDIIHYFLKNIT